MAKLYTVVLKDLETPSTRVSADVTLTNFVTNREERWREANFTHPRTGRKTRARKEAAGTTAWFETYDIELFTRYHNLETQAKKQKNVCIQGAKTKMQTIGAFMQRLMHTIVLLLHFYRRILLLYCAAKWNEQ